MMTTEMKAKLQELLANPEFYSGLCACMEAEKALAYFKANGFALEEREAIETWNAAMDESIKNGALSEHELDKVAAGICIKTCPGRGPFDTCAKWGCKTK